MPADLHVHSLPMAEVQGLRAGSARNEGHQPPNTLGNRTPPHLKIITHTPKIIHTHSTQYENRTERYKIPVQYTNKGVPARGIQNGHDRSPD